MSTTAGSYEMEKTRATLLCYAWGGSSLSHAIGKPGSITHLLGKEAGFGVLCGDLVFLFIKNTITVFHSQMVFDECGGDVFTYPFICPRNPFPDYQIPLASSLIQ